MNDPRRSDDLWETEDDDLIRAAMTTLRPAPSEVRLDEPEGVRGQGQVLKRRRALALTAGVAAAAAIVATLGFRGLAPEDAAPPPVPASPTPTLAPSVSPSVPTMTSTPTATPSASATVPPTTQPTSSRTPTSGDQPTSQPSSVVVPSPSLSDECGGPSARANTTGVSPAAAQAAQALMAWAVTCNEEAMITYFEDHATEVKFGGLSIAGNLRASGGLNPRDFPDRYDLLTALLSLPPGRQDAGDYDIYSWPKVPTSDAEWQHLVDIGLIGADDVARGKEFGDLPHVDIWDNGRIVDIGDGVVIR